MIEQEKGTIEMRKSSSLNKDYKGTEQPATQLEKTSTGYENALAVMDNLVARATTRWTLTESQLFICALSKIKTRDEKGIVKLPRAQTMKMLGIDSKNSKHLKDVVKGVMDKSFFQFDDGSSWEMGFLVNKARTDRWNIYIRFDEDYLPLLDNLSERFTSVYVESIASLSHKASYNLYMHLMSWADPGYMHQNRPISKKEIQKIFNLKGGQYWRNYGKQNAFFDWSLFEKRCLLPAIEDINSQHGKSEIVIDSWKKVKDGKYVLGYDIGYYLVDENGEKI